MRYNTHVATSLAGCAVAAKLFALPFTFGYIVGIVVGSLLPDIDEPRSYVGRRAPLFSRLINRIFGHRGVTHSLLAWLVTVTIYFLYPSPFTLGLSLGYLFHIVGDYFSVGGVPLFSPLSKHRHKAPITYRTSSKMESAIYYISCIVMGAMLLIYNELFTELISSIIEFISKFTEHFK
ncbi:inner membrane protein [Evansella vedderi]|uniref:Inner membrane protein n=1 Tax=Evansella vedderi TaxID=38282 RepID=A0ABT9ZPC5_9BACI|nr:metal-dependent hydrolase [Evansella vedderi]MDQ0253098.1 inner membrane protein [Evansella vedderi]